MNTFKKKALAVNQGDILIAVDGDKLPVQLLVSSAHMGRTWAEVDLYVNYTPTDAGTLTLPNDIEVEVIPAMTFLGMPDYDDEGEERSWTL